MKKRPAVIAICMLAASLGYAQFSTDSFEDGFPSGGTGDWTSAWTHSGAGGAFLNTGSVIDGGNSAGLFTAGGGLSYLTRTFTPQTLVGEDVFASWSFRSLQNTFEIGVTLQGEMSNSSSDILTIQFFGPGSTLTMNDGGGNFNPPAPLTYSEGAIYDVTFASEIGSSDYAWSIAQRGGPSTGGNFSYSAGTLSLTEFSGIQFFWNAPGGAGNDGFIDNVVVPEPSSIVMLGLTGLAAGGLALFKRRKRS